MRDDERPFPRHFSKWGANLEKNIMFDSIMISQKLPIGRDLSSTARTFNIFCKLFYFIYRISKYIFSYFIAYQMCLWRFFVIEKISWITLITSNIQYNLNDRTIWPDPKTWLKPFFTARWVSKIILSVSWNIKSSKICSNATSLSI